MSENQKEIYELADGDLPMWKVNRKKLCEQIEALIAERDAARATANDLALNNAKLLTDVDMAASELDTVRGLLDIFIEPHSIQGSTGLYLRCRGCNMEWWPDEGERHAPDCPAVRVREYLDGKPVANYRELATELAGALEVVLPHIDDMATYDFPDGDLRSKLGWRWDYVHKIAEKARDRARKAGLLEDKS